MVGAGRAKAMEKKISGTKTVKDLEVKNVNAVKGGLSNRKAEIIAI